jgi:VanZ family protein
MSQPNWLRLLLVLALATVSLLLYGRMPQYRLVGPELLVNGDLNEGLDHWQAYGAVSPVDGALQIRNGDPKLIAGIDERIAAPAPGYVGFAADARAVAVTPGGRDWRAARLILASVDLSGNARWSIFHTMVQLAGTHDWQRYEQVFRVPPASSGLLVSAQLYMATGTFEVRHLSVRRAEPRSAFIWASRTLLAIWVISGLWIVWPLLRRAWQEPVIALVVLVGVAIGIATQMPHSAKTELLLLLRTVEDQAESLLHTSPTPPVAASTPAPLVAAHVAELRVSWGGLDKAGHYLMHVLLGFVAIWAFRRQSRLVVLLCLGVFAGLTEVLQNFAIERDPLLSDAMINAAGVLTGAAAALAILWLHQTTRRKRL